MREILFVHDRLESPWVRQNFLESAGFKVTPLESAKACLETLVDRTPALILMDVLIEGLNGFELTRRIRRDYPPEDLPIVLCSEIYRSRLFREEAASAGAQDYVLRPCQMDELIEVIQSVLGTEGAGPTVDAA